MGEILLENQSYEPHEERLRAYLEPAGASGVREFVKVRFSKIGPPIPTHVHPDAMEICYYARTSDILRAGSIILFKWRDGVLHLPQRGAFQQRELPAEGRSPVLHDH